MTVPIIISTTSQKQQQLQARLLVSDQLLLLLPETTKPLAAAGLGDHTWLTMPWEAVSGMRLAATTTTGDRAYPTPTSARSATTTSTSSAIVAWYVRVQNYSFIVF